MSFCLCVRVCVCVCVRLHLCICLHACVCDVCDVTCTKMMLKYVCELVWM